MGTRGAHFSGSLFSRDTGTLATAFSATRRRTWQDNRLCLHLLIQPSEVAILSCNYNVMSGVGYYGCKQDSDDHKDQWKVYDMVPSVLSHRKVDLRKYVDHVYDQGRLLSCTANAVCAAYGFESKKRMPSVELSLVDMIQRELQIPNTPPAPSRLSLYYNTRKIEETSKDSGASLRSTIKAWKQCGVCTEEEWPYVVERFDEKPPCTVGGNTVIEYKRLDQDIDQFRACLIEKCPFVFGFNVYKSFHFTDNTTGEMPMPITHDSIEGSHAVMAVGYDDERSHFIVLNSWGKQWGDKGYFYMPYEFIKNKVFCFDFWKITFDEKALVNYSLASINYNLPFINYSLPCVDFSWESIINKFPRLDFFLFVVGVTLCIIAIVIYFNKKK